MSYAIEINNLCFSYSSEEETIKNLSLKIEKGKYTTILGHNGSGKSTLAKLIVGLLEKESGNIFVDNMELNEENVYEIRNKIGIVFQNPDNQFIGSTVRDDIAFGLENHLVPTEKMDDLINEYALKVGMSEFLDKEPTNLSGGQKQRVAIAGVLVMHPEIIIFDEATSMLDPKGKREIKEITTSLHRLFPDMTVISITHDVEETLLADNVVILEKGKVAYNGTKEDLLSKPEILTSLNLEIPFAHKMYQKLTKLGLELDEPNVEEMVSKLCR